MRKTAVAIRHVHFETLSTFESVLVEAGYDLRYLDVGYDDLSRLDPLKPDLIAVLGGPLGVYETDVYPFLKRERELLEVRLAARRPTLGICLGAQLIAAALGAKVAPTGIKEIGFSKLSLTEAGRVGPLQYLADVPVLHWHGDAFEVPSDTVHLASTPICANQAFALGSNVLGVQFHPEADASNGLEPWLIGHAAELSAAKIDPRTIRTESLRFGAELCRAGRRMFAEWLAGIRS